MEEPTQLTDDPEILALLDFEPVPRDRIVKGSWTPERQRELVIRLAEHGSIQMACDDMGANRTGFTRLRKHKQADSFNAAIDGAITLARRRIAEADAMVQRMEPQLRPPAVVDYRRKRPLDAPKGEPLPGQVLNEHGEWEDEASYQRRGEEAKDSIGMKLVRCRNAESGGKYHSSARLAGAIFRLLYILKKRPCAHNEIARY